MIRLNTERGPVELSSWEDVHSQPGYVRHLDPRETKLKDIVGHYSLPDKYPCGISTCRTPHNRGYLVIAETGEVTNIGNICGKRHFGVDFKRRANIYRQMARDYERRNTVAATQSQLPLIKARVSELKDGERGARWISAHLRHLFGTGDQCPEFVKRQLRNMARQQSSHVVRERLATREEMDQHEAMYGRRPPSPYYIEETLGSIAGIEALRSEHNLRELITLRLEALVDELEDADVADLSSADLRRLARRCGELDHDMGAAARAVSLGQSLLHGDNLAVLEKLAETPKERKAFRRYLATLPGG